MDTSGWLSWTNTDAIARTCATKKSVKFQDSFSFTPADGLVRGSKDLLPHGRSVPLKPVYSNSPMAKYMRLGLS